MIEQKPQIPIQGHSNPMTIAAEQQASGLPRPDGSGNALHGFSLLPR